MTNSASSAHGTTRPVAGTTGPSPEERRVKRWESIRQLGGVVSLLVSLGGAFGLAILATNSDASVAWLAICVTTTLGGISVARACFGSQRAADREAEFMRRLDVDDMRLDELFGELAEVRNALTANQAALVEDGRERAELAGLIREFMAHERVIDDQSAKARSDVATILDMLATRDLEHKDLVIALGQELDKIHHKLAVLAGGNVVDIDSVRSLASLNGHRRDCD